ncbi:MAG: putative serine protease PepD, partial [Actinomycetota bacterium]|nr:putative serine protease PepD [Actinomycetota bacterium]
MATADRASRPTLHDLHDRVMPRTVLGLSALILAFAIGAAFSGVVFYSYYEFRKDKSDQFVKDFDNQFKTALDNIKSERENAKAEIRKELEPLRQIAASGDTVSEVAKKVEPSVWFVRTLDEAGQPSVGSAFVVASDSSQTFMLTSFTTVHAATKRPGPQVVVRKGNQELKADLYTWEEGRDLALLIVAKGDIPKLSFAPRDPALKVGERVFAISGLGSAGTSVSQGSVADVSANGIQHDAAVGQSFQGGPLVN